MKPKSQYFYLGEWTIVVIWYFPNASIFDRFFLLNLTRPFINMKNFMKFFGITEDDVFNEYGDSYVDYRCLFINVPALVIWSLLLIPLLNKVGLLFGQEG
jgi:cephalosporin-C deacetylase-like acetyl esterase